MLYYYLGIADLVYGVFAPPGHSDIDGTFSDSAGQWSWNYSNGLASNNLECLLFLRLKRSVYASALFVICNVAGTAVTEADVVV